MLKCLGANIDSPFQVLSTRLFARERSCQRGVCVCTVVEGCVVEGGICMYERLCVCEKWYLNWSSCNETRNSPTDLYRCNILRAMNDFCFIDQDKKM